MRRTSKKKKSKNSKRKERWKNSMILLIDMRERLNLEKVSELLE
jgi:hypothetical protein